MMKRIQYATILLAALSSQSAFAGPFGLNMGMTIQQIDATAEQAAPGVYVTSKVPKSHSAFEKYALKVGPKSGLCWIKAIGKDVSTSSYGIELKSAFEEMQAKLTKAYGKGETTDILLPGSIWNEPKDWLMAMRQKERFLMAVWDESKGSTLNDDLTKIGLIVNPIGRNKGYLAIEYSFSNAEACGKEIAAKEDDAL